MAQYDVVLVGRDRAIGDAGERLERELRKQGFVTKSFFGKGEPISASLNEIQSAVWHTNLVWTGMSSSAELAKPEVVAAAEATKIGVPLAVYADIEGCQNREWFAPFRDRASLLFVLNEREKEAAQSVYGKNVTIVASGNPVYEEFAFPLMSRIEVRKRLGVADDETLILCLGTKSIPITSFLCMSIVEAIHSAYMRDRTYSIALFLHPGDEGMQSVVLDSKTGEPARDKEGNYRRLKPYVELEQFLGVRMQIVRGTKEFGTPHAIAGADAVVGCGSTEDRRAAYQGIPVIDFFSVVALNRMRAINKVERWEPCELGMAIGLYHADIEAFAYALDDVLTDEGREENRKHLHAICPPLRERGAAVKAMLDAMKPYLMK